MRARRRYCAAQEKGVESRPFLSVPATGLSSLRPPSSGRLFLTSRTLRLGIAALLSPFKGLAIAIDVRARMADREDAKVDHHPAVRERPALGFAALAAAPQASRVPGRGLRQPHRMEMRVPELRYRAGSPLRPGRACRTRPGVQAFPASG